MPVYRIGPGFAFAFCALGPPLRGLALLVAVTVMLSACSPGDSNPAQSRPSPENTESPIKVSDLTGSVEIEANCDGRECVAGWLFIDGTFIAKMPFRRTVRLRPQEYEFRVVTVERSFSSSNHAQFQGRVERLVVTSGVSKGYGFSGRTFPHEITAISGATSGLFEFAASGPPEFIDVSRDVDPFITPNRTKWNTLTLKGAEQYPKDMDGLWQRFLNSNEWRAVADAHASTRTAPPSRNKITMPSLPVIWGGPREIDSTQLKFIGAWLLGWWDREGVNQEWFALGANDPHHVEQVGKQLEAAREMYFERRRWIVQHVQELITALEQAPTKD